MISFIDFFEKAPFPMLIVENGIISNCNVECLRLFRGVSQSEIIHKTADYFIKEFKKNILIDNWTNTDTRETSADHTSLATLVVKNVNLPIEVKIIVDAEQSVNGLLREYYVIKSVADPAVGNKTISNPATLGLIENSQHFYFDTLDDPILELDRDLHILFANKKALKMIGLSKKKIFDKPLLDLQIINDAVSFKKSLEKLLSSKRKDHLRLPVLSDSIISEWLLVAQRDGTGAVRSVLVHGKASKLNLSKQIDFQKYKLVEAVKSSELAYFEYCFSDGNIFLSNSFGLLVGDGGKKEVTIPYEEFVERFVYFPDQKMLTESIKKVGANGRTGKNNSIECRLLGKNGKLVHIFCNISIKLSELGEVEYYFGIVQDITILRDTQNKLQGYNLNLKRLIDQQTAELQRSEEMLSDALKLGNLTTWEYNFQTKRYCGGGEIWRILGRPYEVDTYVMEEAEFQKIIHPEDLPIYFGSFQKALKSQDPDYLDYIEYRIIRSDGSVRNLYLSVKVEIGENGRHKRHYGTMQDITSIRRTEQEKERLTSILEVTPDMVAILDAKGGLIYLNQSGRFFYGLTDNESIESINFIDIQKVDSQKMLKESCFPEATAQGIWTGEIELVGRSLQNVPVSMAIVSHFGSDGEINSYSTIIRNISAQKKTEQDLKYKNAELDTFVYRASHDLRGPISSLLGLYQIVQFEIHEKRALEFFDMFNKQILRLNEIIMALINLTKIKESTAIYLPIDFSAIVEDAIESLRHLESFAEINFEVNISLSKAFKSDKGLITTIIQNLIENSIKYSRRNVESFSKITIEDLDENTLLLKIEDNGIGIGKEIQHRVFDMFFRGHEISKGSGLGLYILKNAVDKLQGEIHVEGVANKGTTFVIKLPFID